MLIAAREAHYASQTGDFIVMKFVQSDDELHLDEMK
jgi:hypothetical protein